MGRAHTPGSVALPTLYGNPATWRGLPIIMTAATLAAMLSGNSLLLASRLVPSGPPQKTSSKTWPPWNRPVSATLFSCMDSISAPFSTQQKSLGG